jgi:hypothetical protein
MGRANLLRVVRKGTAGIALLLAIFAAAAASAAAPTPAAEVLRYNLDAPVRRAAPDPTRFAVDLPHRVTSVQDGRWSVDGTTAVWSYAYRIPGAVSIGFHAREVSLPASAVLSLTAGTTTYEVRGRELANGEFWSRLGQGDTYRLELRVARRELARVHFTIASVQAGYRSLGSSGPSHPSYRRAMAVRRAAATAGTSCVENYECDATAANQPAASATVMLLIANQWQCTGTLLNDVPADGTPYVLTARHCENGTDGGGAPGAAASVTAYFDATTACGTSPQSVFSLSVPVAYGASTVVEQQDVWLLRLQNLPVPAPADLTFAGWDATASAPVGGYSVHHANSLAQQYVGWYGTAAHRIVTGATLSVGYTSNFWEVVNARGSVDHGASGAALFTTGGAAVGVLSRAATARCPANPPPQPSDASAVAFFTAFTDVYSSTADKTSSTGTMTLAQALDPAGSGLRSVGSVAGVPPSGTLQADASTQTVGTPIGLVAYWNNATACTAAGGVSGDGWAGQSLVNGNRYSVTETAPGTVTYRMDCKQGTRVGHIATTVNWTVAPPSALLQPTDASVAPVAGVGYGLSWTANESGCVAGGGTAGDGWSGSLPSSGTRTVTESATGPVTYTLDCGSGATAVHTSLQVIYYAPFGQLTLLPPTAPLLRVGQPITLYYATNTSCTASGGEPGDGWTGTRNGYGYETLTATQNGVHTYVLTCGTATTSVSQAFTTAPAQATLTAVQSPRTIVLDSVADYGPKLNFTSNVAPCAIDYSGPVSGTLISGAYATGTWYYSQPIAGTYLYTLTCGKGSDTATSTATITWVQPPPQVSLTGPGSEVILRQVPFYWTTNVLPCIGSGGSPGDGWDGTLSYNGGWPGNSTLSVVNPSTPGAYTYVITCGEGTTASAQAAVVYNADGGTTLSFSMPTTFGYEGQQLAYSWQSAVGPCSGSGGVAGDGFTGPLATSGSGTFTAPAGNYVLSLVCGSPPAGVEVQNYVSILPFTGVSVVFTQGATAGLTRQNFTLLWYADQANSCTASGGRAGDGWSGVLPTSGQQVVTESVAGAISYGITCANGGHTGSASTTVTWVDPPTVTLSVPSLSTTTGLSVPLSWTSTNATACQASSSPSGLFDGPVPSSGSQTLPTGSGTSVTYTISCVGATLGSAVGTVTVTLVPPPTVTLTAVPAAVAVGQNFTLNWNATDAVRCTPTGGVAGDGWSSITGLTGSVTLRESSAATYTFGLSCTNDGGPGAGQGSVSVTVSTAAAAAPAAKGGGGGLDAATLALLGLLVAPGRRRARR